MKHYFILRTRASLAISEPSQGLTRMLGDSESVQVESKFVWLVTRLLLTRPITKVFHNIYNFMKNVFVGEV